MHAKGVIVTRPEPGLTETLLAVQKAGWDAYPSPSLCITLRELLPLPPRTICAVLVTSGQAIPALCGKIPQEMPFYVVGDRTAERVRQAGFVNVRSANGNAEDLIKFVCQHYTPLSGTLLIATGRGCGITLADTLRQIGFRV
ncbi:MAG: uroporphyrinogen-III synthase, partial [Acetobacter sp.]|nr:uroporphyrinogen-III synthase [Acetobacter sp.]